ncbi:MAG: 5-formyltetrahydrofolate cyclo-ligase [Parvularculaceae bacterium]|nr:5-formyltetrahydrofolate cyclo-ligase [Parvularculaceae bacterium]
MKAERAAAAKARPDAARHAAARFMASIPLGDGAVVALYASMRDELDTALLAEALRGKGHSIALPVVVKKGMPLAFRRADAGVRLIPGRFGVLEPGPEHETLRPDVVVCPMLAFTRAGDRLGYGAGYYDRTLGELRASGAVLAVGYAFGAQEIEKLPTTPQDAPLDWIVTEREAIRAR